MNLDDNLYNLFNTEYYTQYPNRDSVILSEFSPELKTGYAASTEDWQPFPVWSLTGFSSYTLVDTPVPQLLTLDVSQLQEYQTLNSEDAYTPVSVEPSTPCEFGEDLLHSAKPSYVKDFLELSRAQGTIVPKVTFIEVPKNTYEETQESLDLRDVVESYIMIVRPCDSSSATCGDTVKVKDRRKIYRCKLCVANKLQVGIEDEKKKIEMTTMMHAADHVYTEHFKGRLTFRFKCVKCDKFKSMSESSTQKHCRTVHIEGKVKCQNCDKHGRKDYIKGKHAREHCSGRRNAALQFPSIPKKKAL